MSRMIVGGRHGFVCKMTCCGRVGPKNGGSMRMMRSGRDGRRLRRRM